MASVQESSKKIPFDGRNLARFIEKRAYFAVEVMKVYEDIKSDNLLAGEILETFEEIKSHILERKLLIEIDVTPVVSLKEYTLKALGKLSGDKGIPPLSDPGVMEFISNLSNLDNEIVLEEKFFVHFKEVAKKLASYLVKNPVQFHEETINGRELLDILKHKRKLDNAMNACSEKMMRDRQGRVSMLILKYKLSELALFIMSRKPQEDDFERALDNVEEEFDMSIVSEDQFWMKLKEKLKELAIELNKRPVRVLVE